METRKQSGRWQKIQGSQGKGIRKFKASKGKELSWEARNIWGKKKRKDVQMKKLIGTHCKNNIDTVLEEYVS